MRPCPSTQNDSAGEPCGCQVAPRQVALPHPRRKVMGEARTSSGSFTGGLDGLVVGIILPVCQPSTGRTPGASATTKHLMSAAHLLRSGDAGTRHPDP